MTSARLPGPGPAPIDPPRTAEQRAALWGGSLVLVACLLSVDLALRVVSGASDGLIVSAIPLAYLGVAWFLFVLGLIKLSGDRHRRSASRGPWLVVGIVFALVCGPLTGSLMTKVDDQELTYTCACGSRVKARGTRNCWGHWLERKATVLSAAPLAARCPHPPPQ